MNLDELKGKIIAASQEYYSGAPSISDDEFDSLLNELQEASPDDELLKTIGSGYAITKDNSGTKAKHKYREVGSLQKINAGTCEKYFEKHPGQYCITSKIDGGSIVCYYGMTGRFEKAITRGDGNIGIDCTSKLKHIVPLTVALANVAVRGEIIMSKQNFERYYPDAASPRNTALGIIGKDDPDPAEIDLLSFVAYNVYGENALIPTKKSAIMAWLYTNGFTSAQYTKLFDRDPKFLESMKGKLNPEFPADGIVITKERPIEEIAYKFIAETAETAVTKIEWEVSRLGNVIPVVHFNPVKLSGATLAKCSGFNAKWIYENNIEPNSKITIHRAGEVIPYIKEVKPNPNSKGLHYSPRHCPSCETELVWKGVNLYCPNESCPKKIESKLLHWIETLAPVDSLGENILVPFLKDMGWACPSDIYTTESWGFHEGEFTPHAQKLLWIMNSDLYDKPVDPAKFFAAFGLPAVGMNTSKRIADEIGIDRYFFGDFPWECINVLSRATKPALISLEENFDQMISVYLQIKQRQGFITPKEKGSSIKVVITGKLSKSRKEISEEFAGMGIDVVGSVSKEVSYLITDDPASGSSKNLAAQKLGVKVVSENEFRSILKN